MCIFVHILYIFGMNMKQPVDILGGGWGRVQTQTIMFVEIET